MIRLSALFALLMTAGMANPAVAPQSTPQTASQVRAVLFFSPSCPHCHTVITEGLPPIVERFGNALVIAAINTQSLEGQRLFRAAGARYGIPPEQLGVPLLAVGDRVLVGSFDIPDQLPAIVEAGLASGGIFWPDIDGLAPALAAAGIEVSEPPAEEVSPLAEGPVTDEPAAADVRVAEQETTPAQDEASDPVAPTPPDPESIVEPPEHLEVAAPESAPDLVMAPEITEAETTLAVPAVDLRSAIMDLAGAESRTTRLSPWQKFGQDRTGNSIAVLALFGMLVSVVAVLVAAVKRSALPRWPGWAVALIILAGLGVAAYLSYVEVTQSEAICGPVGDCNTVQQSPYARLFGLIPIGILGIYAYAALGLGWMLREQGSLRSNAWVATGLWLLAMSGTLFSIYLTVLEPFVIGATCMWCVTSAVLMTLLLWAATPAAVEAWTDMSGRKQT